MEEEDGEHSRSEESVRESGSRRRKGVGVEAGCPEAAEGGHATSRPHRVGLRIPRWSAWRGGGRAWRVGCLPCEPVKKRVRRGF